MDAVINSFGSGSSGWIYDLGRKQVVFVESDEAAERRRQREANALRVKRERDDLARMRLRNRQKEQTALQKKQDSNDRVKQIQGRVDSLRNKLSMNLADDSVRAELQLARAQLFWQSNPN